MPTKKRKLGPIILVAAIVLLLGLGRLFLTYGSEITIKGAFYDSLGMGGAYSTRWHTTVWLIVIGVAVALVLSLPMLFLRGRPRPIVVDDPDIDLQGPVGRYLAAFEKKTQQLTLDTAGKAVRWTIIGAWLLTFIILIAALTTRLVAARDDLMAWRSVRQFGVTDPIFGRDVSWFTTSQPALTSIAGVAATALALAAIAVLVVGVALSVIERHRVSRGAAATVLRRTATFSFGLGGLCLLSVAALMWLGRFDLTRGGDGNIIGGAGAAVRDVDIPTRTVGVWLVAALAIVLLLLAVPPLRDRITRLRLGNSLVAAVALWTVVAIVLTVYASPWWLILLVPFGLAFVGLLKASKTERELHRPTPLGFWPVVAVASTILISVLGPLGAALNDAIVLRGTLLQVERSNIEATLQATRIASGIDQATVVEANYKQRGVTQAAIDDAPASVASLRFLDIPPTEEACARLQTVNQFYTCGEIDLDRYTIEGKPRTVFVSGREIDYSKLPDFQRRHFTYTHGYGLIMAPVNEIDPNNGRPVFIGGNIPQTFRGDFIQPKLAQPSIYFGAQPDMPFAVVNTSQPEFDRTTSQRINWSGTTGVKVGSGWRRLALTEFLGGLPYVGGGRRIWNATKGNPADKNSDVLLYRDITSRLQELAPFLTPDSDPYFAAADGRVYVIVNAYASTGRYPYALKFGDADANYKRHTVTAVMDAYSGETKLYVLDEKEPLTATWRDVYPELFTPSTEMPAGVREHLRYGEDLFNFQSLALGRFHVTDTDLFFNGDDAWRITQEAYGSEIAGERIESPARYTYAVLPGEKTERFVAIRAYKPEAEGRGIGFSGWLAASNEIEDFGKLTVLRFPTGSDSALDSLDTFTSNVSRDPQLSQEITTRRNSVLRGNTIVVPIGQGLLYVQPLYLDSPGDSLPTLWQVVVSLGDGQVHAGRNFNEALTKALGVAAPTAPSTPTNPGAPSAPSTPAPAGSTIEQLVQKASEEFDAYRKAFGEGNYDEAAKRLAAFQAALAQAKALADQGGAPKP